MNRFYYEYQKVLAEKGAEGELENDDGSESKKES